MPMEKLSTLKLPDNSEYYIQDDSAIASISRSGNIFTATKRDGSSFTFTQKDITISSSSANPNLITITDNDGNSYDVSIVLSDATQSASGLMSSADKTKLDGIESGAEVNQYAFSTIIITNIIDQDPDTDSDGPANQAIEVSTNLNADSKTDSFQIVAGDNVTLVPVEVADKVTINAKDTVYTLTQSQQDGHTFTLEDNDSHSTTITIPDNNTTYTISVDNTNGTLTLTPSEGQPVTVTIPFAGTANRAVADESGNNIKATYGASLSHSDSSNSDINLVNKNGTVISTVSIANASQSEEGLMSASDKTKLDGVATGAEVNQNAFSRIVVGSTNVDADSKTDALTLIAGDNVTLTPNATDDSIIITSSYTNTTYTLTQDTTDPRILTFTGSDGSSTSITTAGKTYTLTVGTGADVDKIILTSSTGDTYKITVPYAEHAGKVDHSIEIKLNGGTTEGTDKFTFDGSASKSLDLTKSSVGLGNVDNTADADKSVSHASTADSATSAGSATKATQDESGNNIKASYGASLSHDSTNSNNRIDLVNKSGTSISNVTIADATTTQPGLLSTSDKTKLNGIATGAEVNQNAFSNVKVGSTTIAADAKTDTLELVAGDNVTLTPDASGDKVTITAKDTTYTPASAAPGKVATNSAVGTSTNYARQDHTHGIDVATGDSNGQVKIAGQNVSVNGLGSAAYKNIVDTYSPTGTDAVSGKAIKAALDTLPEPMVFKGTVGAAGDSPTVTSLPVDGSANIGWTYKVITNGTYAGIASKVGDTFVCLTKTASANTWVLIPSGDEPSGTVTSVGLQNATNGGLTVSGSPVTSSGTITVGHSNVITAGTAKGDDSKTLTFGGTFTIPSVTYDANGHVTSKGTTTMTMPANPNTDTKVTSSANHYTPSTASGSDKSASASGATAAWSIDVVKGVTLNTDGKGHVTGISVTSGKIPANPNTDRYVNSASFADDSTNTAASPVKMTLTRAGSDSVSVTANIPKVSASSAGVAPKGAAVNSQSQSTKFLREDGTWAAPSYTVNTNTTYTFENGTNCFYVTPSGGTKQTVTVTPSITNNITGSGTSGYIAKFNGTNTITNGPAFGTSTTTWLNNKGEWTTPPNDNTTYTIATGDANGQIKVTPSSGSAYNVSVKGLGSNAYTSTAYVAKAGDTMTGNLTFSKPTTAGEKRGFVFAGVTDSAGLYYLEPNLSDDGRMRFVISDNDTDPIEMAWSLYRASGSEIPGEHVVHSFNARGYTLTPIQEKSGAYNPISINCSVNNHGTIGSDSLKWKGIYATTFYGSLQGNADTATSASAVPWTGVTNRPTKLSQFTNDITFATSIATSTGTNQITLALGGKYAITAGGTSYVFTMPSNPNTDQNVAQTATNTNANYEVLFSGTADNTTRTEGARKYSNLLFNPSTGTLTTTKVSSTEIVCATIDADTGNITDANVGNLIVTGAARFLNTINGSISGNAATASDSAKLNGYASAEANTGNTIVKRTSNGYINATYFNQSSGAETPTSNSYIIYANSDGYFRKSTVANMKTAMSLNNVENKSSATIRGEITSANVTTALGYTPVNKAGDTITGRIAYNNVSMPLSAGKVTSLAAGTTEIFKDGIAISNPATSNDVGWMRVTGTGESDTVFEIATGDDGGGTTAETIVVRQYNTSNAIAHEAKLLDPSGNTSFPGNVTAPKFIGNLQGNADYADKVRLYTARQSSANLTQNGIVGLSHFLATSSMTTGKPLVGDGHIIHMSWDNTGGWDAQLAVSANNVPKVAVRGQSNGTWGDWYPVGRFTQTTPTSGQVVITDGTTGEIKSSGYTIASSVPANAKFTDTTYSIGTSGNTVTLTPTGGTAQSITVPYATTAGSATDNTKLPLAGGTMTGKITSTYNQATSWLNCGQNPDIHINNTGASGWIGGNTKTGRHVICTYASSDDLLYFNWYSNTTLAGTENKFDKSFTWNPATNILSTNISGNATTATKANSIATEVGSSAGARPVFYSWLGDTTKVVYDNNFNYNPSGGVLTATKFVGSLQGNADSATLLNQDTTYKEGTAYVCQTSAGTVKAFCSRANNSNIGLSTDTYGCMLLSATWGGGTSYNGELFMGMGDFPNLYFRGKNNGTYTAWKAIGQFTATPTSGQVVITDGTTGGMKSSGYTIATSVPSGAKFTDTNYYHTTGSWSGLTYTATANGGAGALAFTIPTGTSSTTVAVGDHTHGLLNNDFTVGLANTTEDSGWSMINSSYNGYLLKSIRFNSSSPAWGVGSYGSGICFGGGDTKGILSVAYSSPNIKIAGGNGTKPVWWLGLTGTSGTSYNLNDITNGNARDNTKLPLAGGTLTGNLTISHATSATMTADSTNPKITFAENGSQPVHLIYTDYDNYRAPAGLKIIGGASATPAWFEVEGDIYETGTKLSAKYAPITNNAGYHNSIYRGKSLGTSITTAQWNAISAGTFDDLYIGDYWTLSTTINGTTSNINYVIAAFDYWWNCGDSYPQGSNKHHVVLVPSGYLYTAQMNTSNVTTGGYISSAMYTTNLTAAREGISTLFGDHLYSVRRLFTTAVNAVGQAIGWGWYTSSVDLMNENMVYGSSVWTTSGFEVGVDRNILPLFLLNPASASIRATWWLRSVATPALFAIVANNGSADYYNASNSRGVRPAFAIY